MAAARVLFSVKWARVRASVFVFVALSHHDVLDVVGLAHWRDAAAAFEVRAQHATTIHFRLLDWGTSRGSHVSANGLLVDVLFIYELFKGSCRTGVVVLDWYMFVK